MENIKKPERWGTVSLPARYVNACGRLVGKYGFVSIAEVIRDAVRHKLRDEFAT
jgi:Arc/MetJ-type ribon-helix-helix transcriptional regulator